MIKQKDENAIVEFSQTHLLSDNPLLKKDLMSLLVRLLEVFFFFFFLHCDLLLSVFFSHDRIKGELSNSSEFVLSIGGKIIVIAGELSTGFLFLFLFLFSFSFFPFLILILFYSFCALPIHIIR